MFTTFKHNCFTLDSNYYTTQWNHDYKKYFTFNNNNDHLVTWGGDEVLQVSYISHMWYLDAPYYNGKRYYKYRWRIKNNKSIKKTVHNVLKIAVFLRFLSDEKTIIDIYFSKIKLIDSFVSESLKFNCPYMIDRTWFFLLSLKICIYFLRIIIFKG